MKTSTNAAAATVNALIDFADIHAAAGRVRLAIDFAAAAFASTSHGTDERVDSIMCTDAIVEVAYCNGWTRAEAHNDFWAAVATMRAARAELAA